MTVLRRIWWSLLGLVFLGAWGLALAWSDVDEEILTEEQKKRLWRLLRGR